MNTKIDRDMTVTVNTAKDVALTVDGKKTDEWTNANTVGQALADLGVEAKDAELSAEATTSSRSTARRASTSPPRRRSPSSPTVRTTRSPRPSTPPAALKEADIKLDKDDYLSVPMSASVTDGQVLTVNRVENKTVKEKQDIEPKVEKKKSDSLFVGETKVEEK
ncbi:ubiquitin-like domain-containing protein, partial [Brevibacterium casei]|uniref:ubiquitin-like domain-containing protein n=1 Tax=Brevibacterium casei TaxID=33889 RepID=UPI001CBA62B5